MTALLARPEPRGAPAHAAHRGRWRSTLVLVGLFAAAVAFAAYAIFLDADRPGMTTPEGWYARYDQGAYLEMARQLADGDLPTGAYSYGLGYPVLAVPVIWLGFEGDPFSVVDALAFATIAVLIAVLGARLRSPAFGVAAAVAITLGTPVLSLVLQPWNSTVTIIGVLVALLVATHPGPLRARHGVVLGVAIGWVFAGRYVDVVLPLAIGAAGLLGRRGVPWRALVATAVVAGAIGGGILWTHELAFGEGPFRTPYAHHLGRDATGDGDVNDQQLGAYDLGEVPRRALEVFVTGNEGSVRSVADPLLRAAPWLLAAPLGLVALWRSPGVARATRWAYAAAVATSVVGATFYLSFRSGGGDNLKHQNLRYHVGWFPVWGLLALAGGAWLLERTFRDHADVGATGLGDGPDGRAGGAGGPDAGPQGAGPDRAAAGELAGDGSDGHARDVRFEHAEGLDAPAVP